MKREDLKAIEGLTEEQINSVMALAGRDTQTANAEKNALQAQLTTAQQGLAAFGQTKPEDVTQMQSQITKLQADMTAQAAGYQFDGVLRAAARKAGALNEDDVLALLPNKDQLKASQNQAADVDAAIVALKTSKAYLFQTEDPDPQQNQTKTPGIVAAKPHSPAGSDPKINDFIDMSGVQRMELKAKNPALFATLQKELVQRRR